jgi:hypothetical protein
MKGLLTAPIDRLKVKKRGSGETRFPKGDASGLL